MLTVARALARDSDLLVEQHVHRVLEVADRVYLLHRGEIAFRGTAEDARANLEEIRDRYLTATAGA